VTAATGGVGDDTLTGAETEKEEGRKKVAPQSVAVTRTREIEL